MPKTKKDSSRYKRLLGRIFASHFKKGMKAFDFTREEIETVAKQLSIKLPRNLGDVIYSFRYRDAIPEEVLKNQPTNKTWVIIGTGKGTYQFALWATAVFRPAQGRESIKIPDATPEIINERSTSDEQGMLAKVRYNRLIDLFLGVTAYSLQNHLRSTDKTGSQIEIDEVYLAVDKSGKQYIIPVQAKGNKDVISAVQTYQDMGWCEKSQKELICRPVSVQILDDSKIAMFELGNTSDGIAIKEERHFELVPMKDISAAELADYNTRSN